MILRHVDKRWEALAEPHCNISVHVDSKRLKALLEAAHGIKLEGTGVHPEIHAADLRQPQRADGHKACRMANESPASARSPIPGLRGSLMFVTLTALSSGQEDGTPPFVFLPGR